MKNHAIRSPVVMGIAGAILGTVAARFVRGLTAKQSKERIEWQPAGGHEHAYEEYSTETAGLGDRVRDGVASVEERASHLASDVKDKAIELKDRAADVVVAVKDKAMQRVSDVRERLPSAEQIRGSAEGAYRFATDEQPVLGGVLAMGAGMALGFLLPVTEREEELVRPLKARAAENLGQLDDKVRQLADKLDEKLSSDERDTSAPQPGAAQSRPFPSA